MKFGKDLSRILWQYDVCLLHILQALIWMLIKKGQLFMNSVNIQLVCTLFLINATIQLFHQRYKKFEQYHISWVMVIGFAASQYLIIAAKEAKEQVEIWQISSFFALGIAVKLKSQMLLDSQLIYHTNVIFAFFLIVIQYIVLINSIERGLQALISILGIYLVLEHYFQLFRGLELAILRKEFFRQYIGSKSVKDAFIFYNYSSNKVSLEKKHILQHFEDNITQSTFDRMKQDETSSIYSTGGDKKKEYPSDTDQGRETRKKNPSNEFQSDENDDVEVGWLKLHQRALREIREEFKHARYKFDEQYKKHRSWLRNLKEICFTGRQIVDKSLYREYKEVDINAGVHNFKGSLRILKFSSNQDGGVILLRRTEFKFLDVFSQRIEQLEKFLSSINSQTNFSQHSCLSQFVLDKSEAFLNQVSPLPENNHGIHPNQDSPSCRNYYSNNEPLFQVSPQISNFTHPKVPYSSNLIIGNNSPSTLKNVGANQSPKLFGGNNQQGTAMWHSQKEGENNQLKSFNKIPQVVSNIQYLFNNMHPGNITSLPFITANSHLLAPHQIQSPNQAQLQQQQYSQNQQTQNQAIPFSQIEAKLRMQLHCLKIDIKEYSLSCKQINSPGYEKYKNKWVEKEVAIRKEYENQLFKEIAQGTVKDDKMKLLLREEQWIKQQAAQNLANQQTAPCLQILIDDDIQIYQLQKKKQGIYQNDIQRIEDLYQQRSSLINVRSVLDSLTKILSVGERVPIHFYCNLPSNQKAGLSLQEKERLREVYGEEIINENIELGEGSFANISNKVQGNVQLQEDMETFRDMFTSLIQQLYFLYKDYSVGFHLFFHRFHSTNAEDNPALSFRNRYIQATQKQSQIFENVKNETTSQIKAKPKSQRFIFVQDPKKKKGGISQSQQLESPSMKQNENQNQSNRINTEYKNDNSSNRSPKTPVLANMPSDLLETQFLFFQQQDKLRKFEIPKSSKTTEKIQQVECIDDSIADNEIITVSQQQGESHTQSKIKQMIQENQQQIESNKICLSNSIRQPIQIVNFPPQKSVSVQNAHSQLLQSILSSHHIISPLNNSNYKEKNENGSINICNFNQTGNNINFKKLRAARIKIEIQQSESSENQTREFITNSKCLLQVEEFAHFLSPLPMTHKRILRDKQVVQEYIFYIDNFLYRHQLTNLVSDQNLEASKGTELQKDFKSLCGSQNQDDKIGIESIDNEALTAKVKKPKSALQLRLDKISESVAKEEANHLSQENNPSPLPQSQMSSQMQQNSFRPSEKGESIHHYSQFMSGRNMIQQDSQIGGSYQNYFEQQSDRNFFQKSCHLNEISNLVGKKKERGGQDQNQNISNISFFNNHTGELTDRISEDIYQNFGKTNVNLTNLTEISALPTKQEDNQKDKFPLIYMEKEEAKKKADTVTLNSQDSSSKSKYGGNQKAALDFSKDQPVAPKHKRNNQFQPKHHQIIFEINNHLPQVALASESDHKQTNSINENSSSLQSEGDNAFEERMEKEIAEQSQQINSNYQDVHFKKQISRHHLPHSRLSDYHHQTSILNNQFTKSQSLAFTEDMTKPSGLHSRLNILGKETKEQESSIFSKSITPQNMGSINYFNVSLLPNSKFQGNSSDTNN